MDDVQEGSLELLATRRIPILLRRDPRRGLPPGRGDHLRDLHDSHVSIVLKFGQFAGALITSVCVYACLYVCTTSQGDARDGKCHIVDYTIRQCLSLISKIIRHPRSRYRSLWNAFRVRKLRHLGAATASATESFSLPAAVTASRARRSARSTCQPSPPVSTGRTSIRRR